MQICQQFSSVLLADKFKKMRKVSFLGSLLFILKGLEYPIL